MSTIKKILMPLKSWKFELSFPDRIKNIKGHKITLKSIKEELEEGYEIPEFILKEIKTFKAKFVGFDEGIACYKITIYAPSIVIEIIEWLEDN